MAVEHLKCGECNWKTDFLFNCNYFKYGHIRPVSAMVDRIVLDKGNSTVKIPD